MNPQIFVFPPTFAVNLLVELEKSFDRIVVTLTPVHLHESCRNESKGEKMIDILKSAAGKNMVEFSEADSRQQAFEKAQKELDRLKFKIVDKDFGRPWGGYFVIDENQAKTFAAHFFPEINFESLKIAGKLSPKILMVQGSQRLSWQYHHRRAEIWKLVAGQSGIVTSPTDEQGLVRQMQIGEIIELKQGERHRLVGLNGWGMVAEIWRHTDASHPSDESDIVRVQDDFGR